MGVWPGLNKNMSWASWDKWFNKAVQSRLTNVCVAFPRECEKSTSWHHDLAQGFGLTCVENFHTKRGLHQKWKHKQDHSYIFSCKERHITFQHSMKNWQAGCCSNGMLFSVLGLSAAYRYVIGQSKTFGGFILETSIRYVAKQGIPPCWNCYKPVSFLPIAFWYRIKWKGRNLLNAKASTSHMLHSVFTFFWSFFCQHQSEKYWRAMDGVENCSSYLQSRRYGISYGMR